MALAINRPDILLILEKKVYYPQSFGIQGQHSGGLQPARQLSRHTLIYMYN